MEPTVFIFLTQQLYELTKAKHSTDLLSPEALKCFTEFKCSYDGRDIKSLSRCFATKCEVDFYGAESRSQLIGVFRDLFSQLSAFVSPYLTITLHRIDVHTDAAYQAVVSFNAKCRVFDLEVPFTDYSSGNALCRIEPRSDSKSQWHITKLTHEDD